MFRIHSLEELQRLKKVIGAHNNSTVKFPVDLFRDAGTVAILQFGEKFKDCYSYTVDGGAVIEASECTEDLRASWHKRDKEFQSTYE